MANRLALETSPYLLQHAHNPVDWFPWGEEAFAKAKAEDKPIFLSVGYATCHWCHVMERESFEDPRIAQLLNEAFVPIKVDREELPDVDHVYMMALQALTGSGGWPMNLFLTPDLKPFYGGTYFPPEDRAGLPSFARVLSTVAATWRNRRREVQSSAEELTQHLQRLLVPKGGLLPQNLHAQALGELARVHDPIHGGFGGAPKFPQSPVLIYLLALAWQGNPLSGSMLELTLDKMAQGGIYDQVGGGFHRYTVDGIWRVPHFEKMLYDNAQLARIYLGGYKLFGKERYRQVAEETLGYLLHEMRHPEGGFYSAQDADSEGVEGKFYVWSEAEFREVLGHDAEAATRLFGVSEAGNWDGVNVLERRFPDEALREALGLSPRAYSEWVESVRTRLYERRKRRVPPLTDDKILADWNGLALRAFAEAGRILQKEVYLEAARANARFVLRSMLKDGLLRHSWRAGKLRPEAYLSDQAGYGLGLLELYQATGEMEWLEAARTLAEGILTHFRDPQGGFFDSPASKGLPLKAKDAFDGPYPGGNSAAAELLIRLAALYELEDWAEVARGAIGFYTQDLARSPSALPGLLLAHLLDTEGTELALPMPSSLAREAQALFLPLTTLAIGQPGELPVLRERAVGRAYVCRRGACRLPVDGLEALREELRAIYPEARS
ncbi:MULTISPECIES: thioredoxin domain-containing protein [unclassified Meiothermus]|uniref:thioredoxin domain-containing protein n=1 Tax=unclassified Meiothermus TaxID=370471 RepID=UPI000D7BDED3|nr:MULTISPECIES: thioredoxin domain-containing protein [unclassified Meiothermus]PZA06644.1 thioredoxin domain-containing protein [Meiothermus sp. Pnk-1]RYM30249.1 thioredoxin domain-containing protein [Meiothermus sp. PNK-Is4]